MHTHTHNLNNLSSGAGAFTVPPLSNIDTRAQAYSSKYEAKGMGGYIGSAQPKQVYEHLYNQQSHEQVSPLFPPPTHPTSLNSNASHLILHKLYSTLLHSTRRGCKFT